MKTTANGTFFLWGGGGGGGGGNAAKCTPPRTTLFGFVEVQLKLFLSSFPCNLNCVAFMEIKKAFNNYFYPLTSSLRPLKSTGYNNTQHYT